MAYVKKEDVIKIVKDLLDNCDHRFYGEALVDAQSELLAMPDADVEKVKHGEWSLHDDGSGTCKVCGRHQKHIWDMCAWQKYCGHCGAKMDGGRKNDGKG